MGYIRVIVHLLTMDPNFQRDIQAAANRAPLGTIFREDCGEDVEVRPTEVRREIFVGDFSADQLVYRAVRWFGFL